MRARRFPKPESGPHSRFCGIIFVVIGMGGMHMPPCHK
jgi:hypothetical protein